MCHSLLCMQICKTFKCWNVLQIWWSHPKGSNSNFIFTTKISKSIFTLWKYNFSTALLFQRDISGYCAMRAAMQYVFFLTPMDKNFVNKNYFQRKVCPFFKKEKNVCGIFFCSAKILFRPKNLRPEICYGYTQDI